MITTNRVLLMTALSAALVLAQGRPGGRGERTPPDPQQMIEMRVNRLGNYLTLTDDQKTRATTIFTEAHAAGTNARTSMQETREQLAAAVKENNTASIDRLATTLGGLSGQLTAIDAKAQAAFYGLLTAEQKTKYDQRPERGAGRPPGGPFGGPGPFRGPGAPQ